MWRSRLRGNNPRKDQGCVASLAMTSRQPLLLVAPNAQGKTGAARLDVKSSTTACRHSASDPFSVR